jgi:hypothetical protein
MTVQECTYPSTVTGNVVTRRDNDDSSGKRDAPELWYLEA